MIKTTFDQIQDSKYLQNKSFNRLRTALKNIDYYKDSVAYNVVDSVIVIKSPKFMENRSGYKAVYNTVVINNGDSEYKFLFGKTVSNLDNYDDSQDFGIAPTNKQETLQPGEVMIIETMEPYKLTVAKDLIIAFVSKYSGIK